MWTATVGVALLLWRPFLSSRRLCGGASKLLQAPMKTLVTSTAILIFSGIAAGQVTRGLQCIANVAVPPTVRSEGITEEVGDLLLRCSGGAPTPAGMSIPQANITVTLNTQVTSRLFSNSSTDALLLIDEPGSSGNPVPVKACPNLSGCPIVSAGTPMNYDGINVPNVFQGSLKSPNAVTFNGIPILAPATNGTRVFRVRNIRANVNALSSSSDSSLVVGFVTVSDAPFITIVNPQQTLGLIQQGLTFTPPSANFVQSGKSNVTAPDGGAAAVGLRFTENFPTAFKTRIFDNKVSDPLKVTPSPGPGTTTFRGESGYVPPPTAGLPQLSGVADSGSILFASLITVPGCTASVPILNSLTGNGSVTVGGALSFGGRVVGNNMSFSATPDGSIEMNFLIAQADDTPGVNKTLNVPVTLSNCSFPSLPFTIGGTGGFAPSLYTQSTLFTDMSDLAPGIPDFGNSNNPGGIFINGGGSVDPIATVRDSSINTPGSLTIYGDSSPSILGLTVGAGGSGGTAPARAAGSNNLVVPSQFDFGVVTGGTPISNIAVAKDASASWLTVNLLSTTTPATVRLKAAPTLPPGNYSANLRFTSSSLPSTNLVVPVTYKVLTIPFFTRWGFANAGSYVNNVVAPGEPFVIFGNNFGPSFLVAATLGPDSRFPVDLGNTRVLFDGIPAPLYYSVGANGSSQVAGFAPFSLDGKPQTQVQIVYNGIASPSVTIPVLDTVPSLFTSDQSGGGQGAILNQNGSVNSASNPESPGKIIVLFGGGAGQTTPPGRDGALGGVDGPLGNFKLPLKVFIDGVQASDVLYSGPAPGLVEGVFQINVRIPANARHPGNLPVLVQIEDKVSQPGVTVAVQ